MKRSRACDDLRALETSAFWSDDCTIDSMAALSVSNSSNNNNTSSTAGQLFQHRVKRSKRVDMVLDNDFCDLDDLSDGFLAAFHVEAASPTPTSSDSYSAFDFALETAVAAPPSSSGGLPPIRRNSRDVLPVEFDAVRAALQFKTKLQLAGVEPLVAIDAADESEILCSRFQFDARCMDPLDKRQSNPFDLSAYFRLSVNPNR